MDKSLQPAGDRLRNLRRTAARVLIASSILVATVVAMCWRSPGPPPANAIGGKKRGAATPVSVQTTSAQELQKLVLGKWEDDYQGSRTLTVRSDGTATMVVEFDGWKARMFTPRLQIETTWTLENGRFNRQTVGGEPTDKVEFVKRRVGDRASDKVVKVTPDRMILIDQDGETRYVWRRVK